MNRYEHAIECLTLAEKQNDTLGIMLFERDYSGVVCQSANVVDLTLQSMLQYAGADVDLSNSLDSKALGTALSELPQLTRRDLRRMEDIHCRILQKRKKVLVQVGRASSSESSQPFSRDDAVRAIRWSEFMVDSAQKVIKNFDD